VDEAFEEYSRLGERGYSPAFYALGAHFYKGKVVERNLDRAGHLVCFFHGLSQVDGDGVAAERRRLPSLLPASG
jgi:hypothetical protein